MDGDEARGVLEGEQLRLVGMRETTTAQGLEGQTTPESTSERSDYPLHPADQGSETFDRERDRSILEQVETDLDDIERALRRLDEGTYGRCQVCDGQIGDDRLSAVPAARFCLAHQAEVEGNGHFPTL
jgi:RNA polymerase-binding transcription factor DksA